jgi:hypothetical protein
LHERRSAGPTSELSPASVFSAVAPVTSARESA